MVLVIHSNLITDDVTKYLSGYDYSFPFAIDETGGVIAALGGSTMLPQTIVVNVEGIVTYNQVGSVTTEKLEALVNEAKKTILFRNGRGSFPSIGFYCFFQIL